jgi:hypothetical protein
MARLYLKRTLGGFQPADEASTELLRKFKVGEVYRADVVKPRSYRHHKLCFALLTLTYQNTDRWPSFEAFRKAVAIEAGHTEEVMLSTGEIVSIPASLSYDNLDELEFTKVFGAMMTVCCRIIGVTAPELEAELSKYADQHYGEAPA